jgi:formylglycine-generating enzyme required for sulfatase activity
MSYKILFIKSLLLLNLCSFLLFAQSDMPEMVLVEGGTFTMGNSAKTAEDEEKPAHKVTVKNFYISKYEVTVAQYKAFCTATKRAMPPAPNWGWNEKHPIVNVTWNDAVAYCEWLSKKTGKKYRLPTEAEWEFAARGGKKSKNLKYAGSANIDEVAWYDKNSNKQTQPVGTKNPNELGLYDMTGNVWEWCSDWFLHDYYMKSPVENPQGPAKGNLRVQRSGSWINYFEDNRITIRNANLPTEKDGFFGFRVAMDE